MTKLISACKAFLWWNELISIPLGILLFLYSPNIILAFEPYAAIYSAGALQKLLFGLVTVFIANGLSWIGLKIILTTLFDFKNNKEHSFQELTIFQKWCILSFWFALFYLGYILAVQTL